MATSTAAANGALRSRDAEDILWLVVFSSFLFVFYFLPAALLLYYAVPRRAQHLMLTLVSFVFYNDLDEWLGLRDMAPGTRRWRSPCRSASVSVSCRSFC